jgi:Cupin-like domain
MKAGSLTQKRLPKRLVFKPLPQLHTSRGPPVSNFLCKGNPFQFPRAYFAPHLPAISRWFEQSSEGKRLSRLYFNHEIKWDGKHITTVNCEIILHLEDGSQQFERIPLPLNIAIDFLNSARFQPDPRHGHHDLNASMYIAQTPLADLPEQLVRDLVTPNIKKLVSGYDPINSSIWLGVKSTRTPLHRDPYANIFAQLCGTKRVRIFTPEVGQCVYDAVQQHLGNSRSGHLRGEEMMIGEEGRLLEDLVWGMEVHDESDEASSQADNEESLEGWDVELAEGDGIHIPLGYWHAVRGVSSGINASVSLG